MTLTLYALSTPARDPVAERVRERDMAFEDMHRAIRFIVDQVDNPTHERTTIAEWREGIGMTLAREALRAADNFKRNHR